MTELSAEDWFDLGKYHSNIKNSRNAIECYKKCVIKNPQYYKAWSNLAAEYFQLKSYQKSIECCKEAIKINQHDNNSWLTLAANYFQLNEDGRASFCFQRAELLGNNKAKEFLKKVKRLEDKLINAELIDVYSELIKEKKLKKIEEEVVNEGIIKNYSNLEIPNIKDKNFIENLSGFLLKLGNKFIVENGGVISVLELYSIIKSTFPSFGGTPFHIIKALKKLEKEKLIEGLKKLENSNILIVEFVPADLTFDINTILEIAANKDYLDYDDILSITHWDDLRINRIMNILENKKIAKLSTTYREGKKWYFPRL